MYPSNDNFCLFVIVPELFRGAILLFLEDPVEIGEIVESALIADLGDRSLGVHQHTARVADTDVGNVVGEGLSRT